MRIVNIAIMGVILCAVIALTGCDCRVKIRDDQKPTPPPQSSALLAGGSVDADDEYGRPRKKDKQNRRHLFPRLRK